MYTHDDIWRAIDRLASSAGYSPSGLAKQAGLDPTTFNKSKRVSNGKPRWPSTESIAKILSVTNMTMADFFNLADIDETKTNRSQSSIPTLPSIDDVRKEAAQILLDTESVLFNADELFTYTSGRKGPVYVDCRRLISFPNERARLMDLGASLIKEKCPDTDILAGGETAGIPYAAFLSERLNLPMLYVRKKPKGFGRMAQIEGCMDEGGKHVMLIEDLQTDGGSKKVFIDALRDAGAIVEHAFVVFHYGIFPASDKNMKNMGVALHSLTDWWAVLEVARQQERFTPKTLDSVESFLKSPEN